MPELYHVYAGHDTNRDWFMLNLKETQLLTRLLYHEWFPTIHYDVHQMGPKGARMFVPPFFDPINPNLDPRIIQGIVLIGAPHGERPGGGGQAGVLDPRDVRQLVERRKPDHASAAQHRRHPDRGREREAGLADLPRPGLTWPAPPGGSPTTSPAVNFVDPWPGGWWRLRDIVDYEKICARSLLTLAARYAPQFQANLAAMARDAIKKGQDEPPYAWLVPARPARPGPGRRDGPHPPRYGDRGRARGRAVPGLRRHPSRPAPGSCRRRSRIART